MIATRAAFIFLTILFAAKAANASPLQPGGSFTSADLSKNAFSHPGKTITKTQKNEFFVGNSFFKLSWVAAPSSTEGRDGLGPTYNAVACAACHPLDGRARAYANDKISIGLLFRIHSLSSSLQLTDEPTYGSQLNPQGVDGVPGEGQAIVSFQQKTVTYPNGLTTTLQKPFFSWDNLTFGPFAPQTFISPRIGAQIIGLGLLEAIPETDILKLEDAHDSNADGISGKANWVFDIRKNKNSMGRFGWKAEQPTVEQQTAAAFLGDVGITSSLFPKENCPPVQIECTKTTNGGTPELEEKILDRVSTYVRFIAVPKARHASLEDFEKGLQAFNTVGCASCHTPTHTTSSPSEAALDNLTIYPFTDLLLHDMGEELSDVPMSADMMNFSELLLAREWRTPPLWGIGMIPVVNGHQQLLHDGRARNVEEAILWHGGEGLTSRNNFLKLSADERKTLIDFVNNL